MVSTRKTISVVIPTIPIRVARLQDALRSVRSQTVLPDSVIIEYDHDHEGSAMTRSRGLAKVTTDYVAFLDDDDKFLPNHLEILLKAAEATGADVLYPGCIVHDLEGREIPGREEWGRYGLPFDPDLLRQKSYIPVTSLVRTRAAKMLGAHFEVTSNSTIYDDWNFYLRMLNGGAKFQHVKAKTWIWNHWGFGTPDRPGNTSGKGDRW